MSPPSWPLRIRCLTAFLVAAAVPFVPPPAGLALVGIVVTAGAGTHLRALRGDGAATLASVAMLASWGWPAYAIATGRTDTHLSAAAVIAVIAVIGGEVRRAGDSSAPRATAGLLILPVAAGAAWWMVDPVDAVAVALGVLAVLAPVLPALGSATARLAGDHRAARMGCSLGPRIEAVDRIDTLVIDKDRTVTTGELQVVSVDPVEPDHDRSLRWFAGALEHASDHPVGRAIAALSGRGQLTDVRHHPGLGISGSVDRHPVRIGSPAWIETTRPVTVPPTVYSPPSRPAVGTTVDVEVDGRPLGQITVWDRLRPDASEGLAALAGLGLRPVLVTGDGEASAAHLADLLGGTAVHAVANAEERACLVDRLRGQGRYVGYAGPPGVNDEAFTAAHLAISTETETGIAVSDLDVSRLPEVIGLGRRVRRRAALSRGAGQTATLALVVVAASGLLPPLGIACAAAAAATAIAGLAASG